MAFANTKQVSRHDKIVIDGTEVSNAFRGMGFNSEHTEEDVSGFSETGNDETLPGRTATGFTGEFFYSEQIAAILYPIHANREVVEMSWQPDGLVDATREIYTGNVTINQFSPNNTRGSVSVSPFTARAADQDGITATDFT